MKIILLKELQGRGGEGDVIDVPRGFATNYLFRQGIAVEATKGELKQLAQRRHNIEKRELARTSDADKIKEALDGKTIKVFAKVGEEGQLFGSITAPSIAEAITEQIGANIDRRKIELSKPIKQMGEHQVSIALYRDIKASVTVNVLDESNELEILSEIDEAEVAAKTADEAAEKATETETTEESTQVQVVDEPAEKAAEQTAE